jgi:hypothetical protein
MDRVKRKTGSFLPSTVTVLINRMLITITGRAQDTMEIQIPGQCAQYDSLGTPFQLRRVSQDAKTTVHQLGDIDIQMEGRDI